MLEKRKLRLYNSLSNKIEEFKPIKTGEVKMYVCGPTVYNYIHIGNARPAIFFDVVYRYFTAIQYNVTYISNFTDIDDKIINRAILENVSEEEITKKYIAAYNNDISNLNCLPVNIRCKVTDYMDQIDTFINKIIDNSYAYKGGRDVYFDVSKLNTYGALSNNTLEGLNAGERVEINQQKKHPADFTLWKETNKGIVFDSKNGKGRPGWHTECVVMIKSLTDGMVDIHGGGQDLCFPHHENEMAQSIVYDNTTLANYWMHNRMLNLNNDKMSKSLGNVLLVKDVLEKYEANVVRLSMLQTHYRSIINFNDELMKNSEKLNSKIYNTYKKISLAKQLLNNYTDNKNYEYLNFLEDDFNTPNLITYMLEIIKSINIASRNNEDITTFYTEFNDICYVLGLKYQYAILTEDDKNIYYAWENARKNKDFTSADEYRKILEDRGII
ncbi:MAG: cysteine--tRNA ligase [Bacilli bacterium]